MPYNMKNEINLKFLCFASFFMFINLFLNMIFNNESVRSIEYYLLFFIFVLKFRYITTYYKRRK